MDFYGGPTDRYRESLAERILGESHPKCGAVNSLLIRFDRLAGTQSVTRTWQAAKTTDCSGMLALRLRCSDSYGGVVTLQVFRALTISENLYANPHFLANDSRCLARILFKSVNSDPVYAASIGFQFEA